MRAPAPPVDKTHAIEKLDGLVYKESYRSAVIAASPPGVAVTESFWCELEATIETYLRWELRQLLRPPLAERARWQRVGDLAAELMTELHPLHWDTPRTHSDADWAKPALRELAKLIVRAQQHLQAYSSIAKGHSRRRNDSREFLYEGIFHLWTKHLRQKLGASRGSDTGIAGGPLIKFVIACTQPILRDETPADETLVGIIRRAQRRHGVLTRKK